jgi:hypothetical protein
MEETLAEAESEEVASAPTLRAALRSYTIGFALLGAGIGYFAGSSNSPVVGTLLPLLFGLTGGASGMYVARTSLDEPMAALRIAVLGRALVLFVVCCFVGSAYGISLRLERSIWSFASPIVSAPEGRAEIPESALDDPTSALEFVLLRARLGALGVPVQEQERILRSAAEVAEERGYWNGPNEMTALQVDQFIASVGEASGTVVTAEQRGLFHVE